MIYQNEASVGPLVTIGIPNYNYGHYIVETLDSVVQQNYENLEIIIVDDCSSDNSLTVIENWVNRYKGSKPIKIISNKTNQGLTKVCNIILKEAKGKYFQSLDADDIVLQDKIIKQVEVLERTPDAAFVYSNLKIINEAGYIIHEDYLKYIGYDHKNMPTGKIFLNLFKFNFIPLPSVLVNTEKARSAGGFDETIQVQDYYMWFKLSQQYEAIYLDDYTGYYRVHSKSMSNRKVSNRSSVESVLKIKHSYYSQLDESVRQIIRKELNASAVYLYEQKSKTALHWLKRAFYLNPSLKTFVYYLSAIMRIPYSFFFRVKSILNK